MSTWPAAYVDVWPIDGGPTSLSSLNGSVLSVSTAKDIWDTNSGSFQILLPPGGPYGPNATPQWIDTIPPMSLVVIGLQRSVVGYSRANIVMIGVVTSIEQDTEWVFGDGVRRVCRISGQDFSYFFNQQAAYCSTLLRFAPVNLASYAGALSTAGIASGTPDSIANTFYNNIMAGSGGIMSRTKFRYNGQLVPWASMVATDFVPYPSSINIPAAWNYLAVDGTWTERFQQLFPFPWYEFMIATAVGTAAVNLTDRNFFSSVSPTVIARPLPLPTLTNNGQALNMTLWNALPTYAPDGNAILAHSDVYDISDIKNFYMLNPTYLNTLQGISNQQLAPWVYLYAGWIDIPSIQRYGYKPHVSNIYWLADPLGNQAQQNATNQDAFQALVSQIALVPVSYYEPSALMARCVARLNLRPDIFPGVKFQYSPDKAGTQWLSYVRSVSHNFVMGEDSTTTLGLCRSLPVDVYNDQATLLAIHNGQAGKVNGMYTPLYSGIEPFNLNNATADLAALSNAFTTPGAK